MARAQLVNIVAVLPIYPPGLPVGSFLATHEFLAELARRGHSVTVYRRMRGGVIYDWEGVQIRPGQDDPTVVDAIETADLVISHCGDEGFAPPIAARFGVPNVQMVHSAQPTVLLDRCALAVFNSESLAAEVGWDGPQLVAHPPLRPGVHATPGDRTTLINLTNQKGAELFWRLARKRPARPHLGVCGGWGLQIEPRTLPIKPLPNVEIADSTSNIAEIYRRTRVLLMPSERETWGMVGVEAMSCGIPVIAHPTAGLLESLGDAGIFVDRENEAAWLDTIDRLDDPGEWATASQASLARTVELELDNPTERFADAIESILVAA